MSVKNKAYTDTDP